MQLAQTYLNGLPKKKIPNIMQNALFSRPVRK